MGNLFLKLNQGMKSLTLFVCLIAVALSAYVPVSCDNPMLAKATKKWKLNNTLEMSVLAPAELPVCKPLQGKGVCCKKEAFDEIKKVFENIKGKFKKFVQKRKARIEDIEKDLYENQAMERTDAFKMQYRKLKAQGKVIEQSVIQ